MEYVILIVFHCKNGYINVLNITLCAHCWSCVGPVYVLIISIFMLPTVNDCSKSKNLLVAWENV
jgi:hypothetical protein